MHCFVLLTYVGVYHDILFRKRKVCSITLYPLYPYRSNSQNPLNRSQGGPQFWSEPFEEEKRGIIKALQSRTRISKIKFVGFPCYSSLDIHQIPMEGCYQLRQLTIFKQDILF